MNYGLSYAEQAADNAKQTQPERNANKDTSFLYLLGLRVC